MIELPQLNKEEALDQYFDLGLVGMAITSPTRGCLEVSRHLCSLLGYEREELLQMEWSDVTHPDDLPRDLANFQRALAGEIDSYTVEKRWLRKDGSTLPTVIAVKCLRRLDGSVEYFVALVQDLTERHHMEESLRASEELYRTLFESIDEGFCVIEMLFDEDGKPRDYRFLEANAAVARPATPEEVVGRTALDLVPDLEKRWFDIYGQVALTGEPVRFEDRVASLDIWYDVYAFRLGPEGSCKVGVLSKDITERKQTEECLRESEQALRAANRVKDEFLGLVSHELRTPLTTIVGNSLVLSRLVSDLPAFAYRDVIEDIVSDSLRLQRIIENLLLLTRIESHHLELEPVSLLGLAHSAIEAFRERNADRDVQLIVGLKPPVALGTSAFVLEILDNLLSNADKYSPAGKQIEVCLTTDRQGWPQLTVRDEGMGIDPADMENIFSPFYRSSGAVNSSRGGLGLGLTVCKRLVEAQGGKIWAHARKAGGTSFSFVLAPEALSV